MQKVMTITLAVLLILSGCGGSTAAPEPTAAPTAEPTAAPTATPAPTAESMETPTEAPTAEVDEGLFNVTITIPKDYAGEETQEHLDEVCAEKGYRSVTLNEDGSVTYSMTRNQHREMLAGIEETIQSGLDEICNSPDYPGIDAIEAGEQYREFTIKLNTSDLGYQEMFSAVILYGYGLIYNAYLEDGADNIHVTFINKTGDVILEADSRDMKF